MAEPTGLVEAAGRGGGAIVNLSSTAGVESVGSPAGWVSATHGVMGLTKVAALDHPGRGDRGDGDDAREQPKEVLMSTAPTAKLVASGQGKTVMLYEVRFDYKVQSAESGGGLTPGGPETYFEELAPALREHAPPSDYYALAARYGLTIQDDWIEELERTYGVKL